jgi:SMI1 / KNR4 family (SUKH-1)
MRTHLDKDLVDWYNQFASTANVEEIHWSISWFKKVDPAEIDYYEKNFNFVLPAPYREFLINVGEGRLARDRLGRDTVDYANMFMGPKRIADVISKSSEEWLVYPDFIDPDEVPFFDLGNQSVYVFDPGDFANGAVRFPGIPKTIAPSFNDFIRRLHEDITFYIDEPSPNQA